MRTIPQKLFLTGLLINISFFLICAQVDVSFDVDTDQGCAPLTVQFENTSTIDTNGVDFTWNIQGLFDTTAWEISYTFNQPGNYWINLDANDINGYIGSYNMEIEVWGSNCNQHV